MTHILYLALSTFLIARQSASFKAKRELLRDRLTPSPGLFRQPDGQCEASPLSDNDVLGHGNPACRYEPTADEQHKYRQQPEDIAVIIPTDKKDDWNVPERPERGDMREYAKIAWRDYARFHGYAFYVGALNGTVEQECPGIKDRPLVWVKACAAKVFVKRHKYLFMPDTDTIALKPRLRLEPLFELAGMLDDSSHKVMAISEEWGSCQEGRRWAWSGNINTGIMLFKQGPLSARLLSAWWNAPYACMMNRSLLGENALGPVTDTDVGSCQGCDCLIAVTYRQWALEQKALDLSVITRPELKHAVSVFRTGCPFNSPWADWVAHFVSGTADRKAYNVAYREPIFESLFRCTQRALHSGTDDYARCSICDALQETTLGLGSFTASCPH